MSQDLLFSYISKGEVSHDLLSGYCDTFQEEEGLSLDVLFSYIS